MVSGELVILRHGESAYNRDGAWTGVTDVGLTDKGRADARAMGVLLRPIRFDAVYTSCLKRAQQTRDDLLESYGPTTATLRKTAALNERDYGELTGLNKWEVRERVGAAAFADIRRGFDAPIPNGETLRDVSERVVPWYRANVVPRLLAGQNVLLVGHGNSDRALRKYVEQVSDEAVKNLEMDFDKIYVYRVDEQGRSKGVPEVLVLGAQ